MSARCPDGHVSDSTDYCDVCGLPMTAAPSSSLGIGPTPTAAPASSSGAASNGSGPSEKECPNCQSMVPGDDLFCEVCGYDFTTGALPAPVTIPGGIPVHGGAGGSAQLGGAATVTPAPAPVYGGPAGPGAAWPTSSPLVASGAGVGAAPSGTPAPAPGGSSAASTPASLVWVAEVWVDPDWYGTQESDEPCPSAGMPTVKPLWDSSVLIGRRSVSRNIHPQVDCGNDHGVSRRHAQLSTDGQRWWAEDLQSSNGTYVGPAGAPLPSVPIPPGQRTEFVPGDRIYVGAWTRIVVRKATPDEQ